MYLFRWKYSLFIVSNIIMYHFSYSICSDPDDVLKTKTLGRSSFYYPLIFHCFIKQYVNIFVLTCLKMFMGLFYICI